MNSINTNMSALAAQQNMQKQNAELDEAMARLSSGLRINSAADDAAGSAIASKMEAQVRSLDVAIRNSYDAISMTQTVEGALGEMENILQRVRELSVQASNSTLSASDRAMIQSEVDALTNEIDSIAKNTHFNNVKLLDGSNTDVTFQIGMNAENSLKVNLEKSDSLALGLSGSTGTSSLGSERVAKTNYLSTGAGADDLLVGNTAANTELNGAVTLDGVNAGTVLNSKIAFTSNVDDSADTITIIGTDTSGNDVTETVTGPNNQTVLSSNTYATIRSISLGSATDANAGSTYEIGTIQTIAAADIKINGFNALAADFTTDLSGSTVNTAKTIADAINANTGVHGAEVNAYNTLTSDDMGSFNMTQTFTINGETVNLSSSLAGLVNNINEAISGVNAIQNADNTITLANTTGDDIIIASNSAAVGFTAGTYTGFLDIKNLDGSGTRIEAGSVENGYTGGTGTIDDLKAFGLNESSVANVVESDTVSGTALSANEVKINGVHIGESTSGSAAHVATAINEKTAEHGVTAVASNAVTLTFDFQAAQPTLRTSFKINGSSVDLSAANDASEVVTAVNNANIGDLRASAKSDGTVKITSASGVDIIVANSDNDFLTAARDVQGNSIFTGFGNGTFDLDGLLANTALVAEDDAIDTSGSSLIGEVVNSRVVITQKSASNSGTNAKIVVTGTNAAGAVITETLTLTDGTVNDQIQGSTVFHTVTGLATSGTPDTNRIDVGFNGRAVLDGAQGFDDDSLFSSGTNTAAGALTLSGDKVKADGTSVDLHGAVVVITGEAGDYSSANVNFTVVGTDAFGATISEVILLDKNDGEVHGSTAFHTITSITTDAALLAGQGADIGTYQVGDRIVAKGMMTLSNDDKSPIQIEAVGKDHTTLIAENGATNTILDKLGLQNQSQSFEVASQGVDVRTEADANSSLAKIDKAIDQLSLFRSSFGAVENRIDASINNLTTLKVNTEAAKARIMDADFAAETSRMTKSQILSQAATSMLAQANASKQNLLALLQG